MMQDKIKVREVLRTVESKQKELMSMSFYSKNRSLLEKDDGISIRKPYNAKVNIEKAENKIKL